MKGRMERQLEFIIEIDKLKHVFRRTRLFNNSRHENDAEHGWHLAVMALVMSEYADEPVDVNRVVKMVLVHDIVEADAGDTFLYDEAGNKAKAEAERRAADRIFGLLPEDQEADFRALWEEFEARRTAEARFAAAIDRLEPIMQNALTAGYAWKAHDISRSQVMGKNRPIVEAGSKRLWELAQSLINRAAEAGDLRE